MSEDFENFAKLLKSSVMNLSQSFYDDYVEQSVNIAMKSGIKVTITRRSIGKCCDWCSAMCGTYEYGNHPPDIFKRHANCTCLVTFNEKKDGSKGYTDVWTKKEFDFQRSARIDKEKELIDKQNAKYTGGRRYAESPNDTLLDKAAKKAYNKFIKENDIEAVSKSSGLSFEEIKTIKRHVFFDKHNIYGEYTHFEPDYDMAVAWKRLREGKPLDRDICLLRHELLESSYEKKYNHIKAHELANKKYDWGMLLHMETDGKGEPYGLL